MENRPATLIIAAKAGRLGNRLFLSAYFMANALAKGYRLLNPALGEYAPLFEGSAHDSLCRFPNRRGVDEVEFASQCREVILPLLSSMGTLSRFLGVTGVREVDIRDSHDAEDRVYDLGGDDFHEALHSCRYLLVKGWKFRDDVNLVRYRPEISRYFRPIEPIRRAAEITVDRARSLGALVVGVHIRQSDYRDWKNGVHYFETTQYAHWMREVMNQLPEKKIVFLLCASDPIDRGVFEGLTVVDGPGRVAEDLHALSLCDLIMGPPSTFSTWASYSGRVPLCMLQHAGQAIAIRDFVLHDRV
jgi:hypothetical protein